LFDKGGFNTHVVGVQLLGVVACFVWSFGLSYLMFKALDRKMGIRVSRDEELEGLDVGEHGGNAYPDFGADYI